MSRIKAKRGPKKKAKGTWVVTAENGTVYDVGYYPNPRMAVAIVQKYSDIKVKSVKFYSIAPMKAIRLVR